MILAWLQPVPPELTTILHIVNSAGLTEFAICWVLLRRGYMLTAQIFFSFAMWVQLVAIIFTFPGQQAHLYLPVSMLLPYNYFSTYYRKKSLKS